MPVILLHSYILFAVPPPCQQYRYIGIPLFGRGERCAKFLPTYHLLWCRLSPLCLAATIAIFDYQLGGYVRGVVFFTHTVTVTAADAAQATWQTGNFVGAMLETALLEILIFHAPVCALVGCGSPVGGRVVRPHIMVPGGLSWSQSYPTINIYSRIIGNFGRIRQ